MSGSRTLLATILLASVAAPLAAQRYKPIGGQTMPDTLELTDGTRITGLVLRNTADNVLLQ